MMHLPEKSQAIVVPASQAQNIRQQLEKLQLWNGDFQCGQLPNRKVAIPIVPSSPFDDRFETIKAKWPDCSIEEMNLPLSKKSKAKTMSPACQMKDQILQLLKEHNLSEDLVKELPKKWEKHDDLVLLPESAFSSSHWNSIDNLWGTLSKCLKCARLARHSSIAPNGFRSSQVVMLLGQDGVVTHIDNGIKYKYDVTKSMFSAGNITEKLRLAKLDCKGEVIVDLYAGIGYFTLPYLIHAQADHVHACEWNPDAVQALRTNLTLNGVAERCTVHYGDNRQLELRSVADRVNLGLIPSSEDGWPVAVQVLKDSGGILHVHGNVTTVDKPTEQGHDPTTCPNQDVGTERSSLGENSTSVSESHLSDIFISHAVNGDRNLQSDSTSCTDSPTGTEGDILTDSGSCSASSKSIVLSACRLWSISVQNRMKQLLETNKAAHWCVEVKHIEVVKWYAPHVVHVVVDLRCTPVSAVQN